MENKPKYLSKLNTANSVVKLVIDRLTDAIIDGELKSGDKLPTEYELCESLGVGRNAVREAIKVLEFLGVVEIRHAEGTFITNGFNIAMMNPLIYGMILKSGKHKDLYNFRKCFEIGTMIVAIDLADEDDILRIEKAFENYKQSILNGDSCDQIIEYDNAFHLSFCEATKNEMIVEEGRFIGRVTYATRVKNMENTLRSNGGSESIAKHQRMLDVLKSRDKNSIHDVVKSCYQSWSDLLDKETYHESALSES